MSLANLPEVEFISADIDVILNEMIEEYEDAYYQQTGISKKLYPGDPIRIFLYTQALREFLLREAINENFKQNLLAYATNENLDHFAARYGIERFEESFALMTVRFTLSTEIPAIIPAGTRMVIDSIYFETANDAIINSGQVSQDIVAVCQIPGTVGNDIPAGSVMTIVDPLPFVISAVSTEKSIGGTDRESDEELRERVYSTPETLSVAGPEQAYISLTENYSNAVLHAGARQISPGVVEITTLLQGGELPNEAFLSELNDYLSDGRRRPLTDKVIVRAPEEVLYNLDLTYYLLKEQAGQAGELTAAVNLAVENFIKWQKSKLGRDINPSELIFLLREAGAKRVVVAAPEFAEVPKQGVAISQNVNIVFGGFEDE